MKPVGVVLHGGASESWVGDATSYATTKGFLEELVKKAEASLRSGARAVDVATETVAALEDFPEFNAGKGSAVNADGLHELEAAIVNGDDAGYRAAVCLQTTRNPIRLARAMLGSEGANTPVFIAGPGGDQLACRLGLETVPNSYFATDRRMGYWKAKKAEASEHGTVGAVVLDAHGSVAVANSTGGMMFKPAGRVGDTAILGSGVYADKRIAVACSGGGEAIITSMLAGRIAMWYHGGAPLAEAVEGAMWEATRLCPSISCGVIALTADGDQTAQCNSRMFATASAGRGVSTRAGLLPCTMPVIAPLSCYDDGELLAGLSKHPTRPGQLTFCLRDRQGLAGMDRERFLSCFQRLRRLAGALARVSEANHVAVVTFPGGKGGHLFPVCVPSALPGQSEGAGDEADRKGAGYVANMSDASVTIRRRSGRGACPGGFLLGPDDEFRGVVEALWDAFERGLRAALQGVTGGSQWSIASLSASASPSLPESLGVPVLLASPHSDPHWPSPAPVGAGTGGLTSALGPRALHVQPLCAVAATLRASLGDPGALGGQ